jgi:uncharacterized membrane protein YoaK (UPF0700 family)
MKSMLHSKIENKTQLSAFLKWFIMALNSGFINIVAFLSTGTFVTHVTGFATMVGVETVYQNYFTALELLTVPVFFLLGSFFSGLVTASSWIKTVPKKYTFLFGLCSILTFFSIYAVDANIEVHPNIDALDVNHYLFLTILCFVSGVQNAALSTLTSGVIRTTHMTGVTTDLGVSLANYFFKSKLNLDPSLLKRLIFTRMFLIFFFVSGSFIGGFLFHNHHYLALTVPGSIFLFASVSSFFQKKLPS